jgi:HSP20 family protein
MTKALTKLLHSPFEGLFPLSDNRVWREFEELFMDLPGWTSEGWQLTQFPRVNIFEEDDGVHVEAALAGYEKSQLFVEVKNNLLTIRAQKKETEEKTTRFASRSFTQSFRIGDNLDTTKVDAKFENGLLTVFIPRPTEEKTEVKSVEIK